MRIKAPVLREFNVAILRVEAPIAKVIDGEEFIPNVHEKFISPYKYMYMDIDVETGEILNPSQENLPENYSFIIKTNFDRVIWSIREHDGCLIRLIEGGNLEITSSECCDHPSYMRVEVIDGFIHEYVIPYLDAFFEDDSFIHYLDWKEYYEN